MAGSLSRGRKQGDQKALPDGVPDGMSVTAARGLSFDFPEWSPEWQSRPHGPAPRAWVDDLDELDDVASSADGEEDDAPAEAPAASASSANEVAYDDDVLFAVVAELASSTDAVAAELVSAVVAAAVVVC